MGGGENGGDPENQPDFGVIYFGGSGIRTTRKAILMSENKKRLQGKKPQQLLQLHSSKTGQIVLLHDAAPPLQTFWGEAVAKASAGVQF